MSVLVVGSIALDTVKTPVAEKADLLGGSASYAAVAASFFSSVNLVGVVGEDFPAEHVEFFGSKGVNLDGLEQVEGKTFRWSGEYLQDMNTRETRNLELNVFEHFEPKLPPHYRTSPITLLANIAPSLQSHVLDQSDSSGFVIADTMDLWISIAREDLLALCKRLDLLILNDGEARLLTGKDNLIVAGREILTYGPKYVIIKKGEHGSMLFGDEHFFICGAYPIDSLLDPTGAGDCYVGALAGYLSAHGGEVTTAGLRKAIAYGAVVASYNVEDFSLERLRSLQRSDIDERYNHLISISQIDLS